MKSKDFEEIAKSTDVFFAEFDNGRFNGNILITEWKNNKLELMPQAVSNNQENDNESYNEVQSTSYQENADNNTNNSSSNNDSSTSNDSSSVTVPQAEEIVENSVWVPVNGGTKYHSKAGCSNMIDPVQVSEETAIANGYEPCKRCY